MNKAITEGLALMPKAFAAGLHHWSSAHGQSGDASYASASGALLIESDPDFGSCLELEKTAATQRLRAFAPTPLRADMYLRLRVRVKAVAGNLMAVRLAAWAGTGAGANVGAVPQTGPAVALNAYGEVVTLELILGAGNRTGVDLVWGNVPQIAHVGLDLTGPNGGVIRIEDITVEDVTNIFLRDMLDLVDVRDYGALGDGLADDRAAFQAADLAAGGRMLLVPAGNYRINGHLTLNSPVRIAGSFAMASSHRLVLTRNLTLDAYGAAFGGTAAGFRRALQALFHLSDHVTLDLSGRRIDLDGPIDVAELAGITSFTNRRVLRNGALNAVASSNWQSETVTSLATYSPTGNATRLTDVANIANIPLGALVSGTGVGREVYVLSKNVGAGTLELSQPLYGASGTRSFSFKRFKYMLDFSGFSQLSRFELQDLELNCLGQASGVMLAQTGGVFRIDSATFNRPKDRAITSSGTGCQGLQVDYCQFLSDEQSLPAQERSSIALNVNANDAKIRNNRVVRFRHFAVLHGSSHMISANHFFQGDEESAGLRLAGLIFTQSNVAAVVQGNYIDNCFIEWGNEHDASPGFSSELSFGGLNISGNMFIASHVSSAFRWIVVKPYGAGHFLNGFGLMNNTFRVFNATIDRVDMVDETHASLDMTRTRDVRVEGNTFNQVARAIANPLVLVHQQSSAAESWTIDSGGALPFGGRVRMCESLQPEGAVSTAGNVARYLQPYAQSGTGGQGDQLTLRWGEALKGRVVARLRMDLPS